jgi:hypothetical protein
MANALAIPELTDSQSSKYATVNLQLKYIAALMTGARDIVSAYPGSPAENGCYIVGAAWYEMDPVEGLTLWVWDENVHYVFNGTRWLAVTDVTLISPSSSASPSV